MPNNREHVISVVLNHQEWKAFLQAQPQPVDWLRDRIRETITTEPKPPSETTRTGAVA